MPIAPPRFGYGPATERKAWRTTSTSGKTTTERGYGWQHQKARARLLMTEPLCRECRKNGRVTVATIADHEVPLSAGGSRDEGNLQPMCAPCHAAKTKNEANWKK